MTLTVIVIVVVVLDLVLDLHAVALVDHSLVPLVEVLVARVRDPSRLLLVILRTTTLVQSRLVVAMILAAQKEVVPGVLIVNVFVMMTSKSVGSYCVCDCTLIHIVLIIIYIYILY